MKRVQLKTKAKAKRKTSDSEPSVKPLLCDRSYSARLLGTNVAMIRRLEDEGRLKKVRLRNRPTAKVSNIVAEVEALARGAS